MKLRIPPSVSYQTFFKDASRPSIDFEWVFDVSYTFVPSITIYRSRKIRDSFQVEIGGVTVLIPAQAVIGMYELLEMMSGYLDDRLERKRRMWLLEREGKTVKEIAQIFSLSPATVRDHIKSYKGTWQCHVQARLLDKEKMNE